MAFLLKYTLKEIDKMGPFAILETDYIKNSKHDTDDKNLKSYLICTLPLSVA